MEGKCFVMQSSIGHEFEYLRPKTLSEALKVLSQDAGGAAAIAGGTDLIPALRDGLITPSLVVDISRLDELKAISEWGGSLRIGPLVTMAELESSRTILERCPLLAEAAAAVGGPQVRNRGTIGGNLATGSPAGDSVLALLALDAEVDLVSVAGSRTLPIREFLKGPKLTALRGDELIREIRVRQMDEGERCRFVKVGRRNALAISLASVAVTLKLREGGDEGEAERIAIALGSVAPTPIRAEKAERLLTERGISEDSVRAASELAAEESKPISDIRAKAEYRRLLVKVWLERTIRDLVPAVSG